MVGCDYIEEYKTFLRNIRGQKSKSTILNNGQTLECSLGNEKFVFRKIHDNTYTNGFKHNTKLFGKWIPLEGKLNGKKIVTFAKGAEINIIEGKDWHRNKKQNIRNTDEMAYVGEGIDLTHKYLDEDFVSIQFRHFVRNTNEYKESSYMNEIFRKFTYGCTIKFDETKQTILLEFEGTKLFMKRA